MLEHNEVCVFLDNSVEESSSPLSEWSPSHASVGSSSSLLNNNTWICQRVEETADGAFSVKVVCQESHGNPNLVFLLSTLKVLCIKVMQLSLQTVRVALHSKTNGGDQIFKEYEMVQDGTRRKMVNILVADIVESHGSVNVHLKGLFLFLLVFIISNV